jgi:hypothetical protein
VVPASGRNVAPVIFRCCTEAGTRATPSPAATKATSVDVSATSCTFAGLNPARWQASNTASYTTDRLCEG